MWRIFFHWKTKWFFFFLFSEPTETLAGQHCCQHCCWGFSSVVLAPRSRDSEHDAWGPRRQVSHRTAARRPAMVGSSFSCPPLCPSPPAVLSGVSQYPLGPPQGTGLPGIQPAAPTLPHEAPSDPPHIRVLKRRKDQGTKGVDCWVLFIYFLFFFLLSLPVSEIRTTV